MDERERYRGQTVQQMSEGVQGVLEFASKFSVASKAEKGWPDVCPPPPRAQRVLAKGMVPLRAPPAPLRPHLLRACSGGLRCERCQRVARSLLAQKAFRRAECAGHVVAAVLAKASSWSRRITSGACGVRPSLCQEAGGWLGRAVPRSAAECCIPIGA